jgi:uncharacterized membrane protein YagU involved in acid resistance
MTNLSRDLLAGAAAGALGGAALLGLSVTLYDLADPGDIAREQAIEPRDPFIVLAQKLQKATGKEMSEHQEKVFEQGVANGLSAVMGAAYALTARNWKLGWLTGGVVFGTAFWLVEDEGIGPALGLAGDNTKYPLEAHLRGLLAHVAFGVVTAGLLGAAGLPRRSA